MRSSCVLHIHLHFKLTFVTSKFNQTGNLLTTEYIWIIGKLHTYTTEITLTPLLKKPTRNGIHTFTTDPLHIQAYNNSHTYFKHTHSYSQFPHLWASSHYICTDTNFQWVYIMFMSSIPTYYKVKLINWIVVELGSWSNLRFSIPLQIDNRRRQEGSNWCMMDDLKQSDAFWVTQSMGQHTISYTDSNSHV